jgi:hypothetical protein
MAAHTYEAPLKRPAGVSVWTYVGIPFDVPADFGAKAHVWRRSSSE